MWQARGRQVVGKHVTTLLDIAFARAVDTLLARFSAPEWQGCRLEAWVFEDLATRREAGLALGAAGVSATLHSAYKPLVHAYLEGGLAPGAIALPCHSAALAQRFALEAYPLLGLEPGRWQLVPGSAPLDYVMADGMTVFAPNRIGLDAHGGETLNSCGWLRVWRDDVLVLDGAMETEFQQCLDAVMATVRRHDWPATMPFFETLHVEVRTGGSCRKLDLGHECMDTSEALHEELYFGLIEQFQVLAGLERGNRNLQPGQIVPEIRPGTGATRLRVRLVSGLAEVAAGGDVTIETAARALDEAQIVRAMGELEGEVFAATSVQGRPVPGVHRSGVLPGMVVTAGQHANETSGVVGLLRAAPALFARRDAEVALVALENPDGYVLHRRLCAVHPRQMHHAARYTALGDDLGARLVAPFFEADARREAIARTSAVLHISLHGYPAQEWTRPLSGYVPSGFESWTLPCGFFLILRHHPGRRAQGLAFLELLTAALAQDPDLVAMNRAQMSLRDAHAGSADDALVLHDIACRLSEDTRSAAPFTLITEYPDETIVGDAFCQAHTVQRDTVLQAAALVWAGVLGGRDRGADA